MTSRTLKLDVFGQEMLIVREGSRWVGYYVGFEGKYRRVEDLVIPSDIAEGDLVTYLADLFHESATKKHPDVKVLKKEV